MRVRVLHTLTRIGSGGVEQRRLMLARGLPRDRYAHMIVTQEASGPLPDLLRAEGWEIQEIGLAPGILNASWHRRAYKIARKFRPHVVHGAVIEGVALANGIGVRIPKVKVISEETSDPVNRSWRGTLLMSGMCLRSDVVIGVSPAVGDYLRNAARIQPRKVRVIDNAVLPPPVVPSSELGQMRAMLGLAPEDLVIGSVGRIQDDHKRFSDLIRALAIIRAQTSAVRLLIIGDGPDLSMLKELAVELDLTDAVIFAGYQAEVRKFYPLMDVFALASAHEAFGLVLVEAMLAEVPVVATEVGGMPYVLDHGAAGRLVAPFAPDALARELLGLISNTAARKEVGQAGRGRAERKFSADRYCREIDELYLSLCQQ